MPIRFFPHSVEFSVNLTKLETLPLYLDLLILENVNQDIRFEVRYWEQRQLMPALCIWQNMSAFDKARHLMLLELSQTKGRDYLLGLIKNQFSDFN